MAPLDVHWVFGVERVGILAREVRNGYELVAGLLDLLLGGQALAGVELVEDVGVGRECHRWGVAGLAGDVDDAAPFVDQQRDEAVA